MNELVAYIVAISITSLPGGVAVVLLLFVRDSAKRHRQKMALMQALQEDACDDTLPIDDREDAMEQRIRLKDR